MMKIKVWQALCISILCILFVVEVMLLLLAGVNMNKEISLKKFCIYLGILLLVIILVLYCCFTKIKPFCEKSDNPCNVAVCNSCIAKDNKKVCSDCSVFNEKEERVWTGGCIFDR